MSSELRIPVGLTSLLEEFVVRCLQENPEDLVDFAADHFTMLSLKKRDKKKNKEKGKEPPKPPPPADDEEDFVPPPMPKGRSRRAAVAAEAYNPNAEDNVKSVVHPKTEDQRKRLKEAVESTFLRKLLGEEQLSELLDAMFERKVVKGDKVIEQGDEGDNFYVIDTGLYDIYVKKDGGDPIKVFTCDNKGSFGELALMYNCPRTATVIAQNEGILWAVDRATFRRIVVGAAARKRKMYEELLESVPMLAELESNERMNLADALETFVFQDGQKIINQGDDASGMYFIEEGTVKVLVKDANGEKDISRLTKGSYFGELALVMKQPRSASVVSIGKCKCARLDIGAFERLLGPCMDIMKRNISSYEAQRKKLGIIDS